MRAQSVSMSVKIRTWANQINERVQSGQTVREWAAGNGVSTKTYYYRLKRVREEMLDMAEANFAHTGLAPIGFTEVKIAEPAMPMESSRNVAGQGVIHFEYSGVKIAADSNYPPEHIALLIRRLTQPC